MPERQHLRLVAALFLATALAGATISLVSARIPPGWHLAAVVTPTTVTNGQAAGFEVTFTNDGPSNASQVYLVASGPPDSALVFTHPSQGTCNPTGPLLCSLGAVNADASATVIVAYTTPASGASMNVMFEINTTGVAADNKKRSHGDSIRTNPEQTTVNLSLTTNKNFFGRFAWSTTLLDIQDDQNLGNKNVQATKAHGPQPEIQLTVGEAPNGSVDCPGVATRPCFSEWSLLNVGGGQTFAGGFTATVTLGHWEIPNGIDADTIGFVHINDDNTAENVPRCANNAPPASIDDYPCFTAVDSGNDIIATFYFLENGKVGGY